MGSIGGNDLKQGFSSMLGEVISTLDSFKTSPLGHVLMDLNCHGILCGLKLAMECPGGFALPRGLITMPPIDIGPST